MPNPKPARNISRNEAMKIYLARQDLSNQLNGMAPLQRAFNYFDSLGDRRKCDNLMLSIVNLEKRIEDARDMAAEMY